MIQQIVAGRVAKKVYPQYYCDGDISVETRATIKKNVSGMVFQKIGNIVLTSVDTIVISSFLGLRVLGIYNGYYYIFTSLNAFLGVILRSLVPSVGNSIISSSAEKNYSDFKKIHMIYSWIVVWWSTCILCLAQPFMELWVGRELMLSDEMVVLFAAYFFFFKWLDIAYVYRESNGIWWQGRWLPIIAATINVILNIILVQIIGLAGILVSTIISLILIHDTLGVYILKKYCFDNVMNLRKFFVRQVLIFVSVLIVSVCTYFVCRYINLSTVKTLIVRGVICATLPNIILAVLWYRWGVAKNIRDLLQNVFRRKLGG